MDSKMDPRDKKKVPGGEESGGGRGSYALLSVLRETYLMKHTQELSASRVLSVSLGLNFVFDGCLWWHDFCMANNAI